MKIGFVGLGIMGQPMAHNLIKGGHELFVYGKRTVPPDDPRGGATVCDTLKAVAEQRRDRHHHGAGHARRAETCCSARTASPRGCQPGKIVVDMSSISPIETKVFAAEINKKGCDYLDAPVSGGEVGAKAASLTIMVGGPEARLRPGSSRSSI